MTQLSILSEDKHLPNHRHLPEGSPALARAHPALTPQAAGPQARLQGALLLLVAATEAGRVLWGRKEAP